ncbi:MAG: PAS domain S-box protein, partial [Humidesulfovibrio sp.]|nr:PAS domain S-box protein [Humidesulfovibrio sp.]
MQDIPPPSCGQGIPLPSSALHGNVLELLRLFSAGGDRQTFLKGLLAELHKWSGCEAVGIRMREGNDYPYYETHGFPDDFVRLERSLCARDKAGNPLLDARGEPKLECMCGNIIQKRYDPELAFFTGRGSFWSNTTTVLLAGTTEKERQSNTRNRCNGFGYESVALVPLRCGSTTYGLLQFNDKCIGRFSPELIDFLECLAESVALALSRQESVQALAASEARYRGLFEAHNAVKLVIDPENGAILDANQVAVDFYGYGREQLLGMTIGQISTAPPQVVRQCMDEIEAGVHKAGPFEFKHRMANGSVRDVEVYTDFLPFGGKKLIFSIVHDITVRKQAEGAVSQSEHMYRSLFENMLNGFAYCKMHFDADDKPADFTYLAVNNSFETLTGLRNVVGRKVSEVIPGIRQTDQELLETYGRVSRTGTAERFETFFAAMQMWFYISVYCPEPGCFVAVFDVITERKQQEEALRTSEREFRLLSDAMPQIVWACSPEGKNIFLNQQWTDYTGQTLEESHGDGWNIPFHPDDKQKAWDTWKKAAANNVPYSSECRLRRADGVYRWWLIRAVSVRDAQGAVVKWFGTCTDIDELKQSERTLIEARQNAEAANKAKSAFLANMSHEIRTPLNGLLGMLQLIRTSSVSSEVESYVEMAIRSGGRLTNLLGDILDLSRIEAGRMLISRRPFVLANVFTALSETFSPAYYSKRLSFAITVAPEVPATLIGDEIRVRQVLYNLVGNAMKFTNQGAVKLEVSRLLTHPKGMARLLFVVSDTGIGIPDEKVGQISAPFMQVSESYTRAQQGAGLGLSIVSNLVKAMDGTLTFESTIGIGTSAYLVLPFEIAEQSGTSAESEQRQATGSSRPLQVLLAEDDEINRLSTRLALEKMGHKVVAVSHGGEALDALRRSTYDCVLMDIQMDVMDGVEATRQIRTGSSGALDAQVPI